VQKVVWTLAELGVEYERVDAGFGYGVTDTPAYLALNPNGTVPTLEEPDGFVLFESNTIVRYLARRYGQGSLAPGDDREYARSEKWMDWASIGLESSLSPLWVRHLLKNYPAFAAQSPALAARHASESDDKLIGAVVRWFEVLSAALPPKGYLLGDRLTIGDVPVGQLVSRWYKLPIEHPSLPRIRAYFELLSTRPAYRDHVVAARALT
jgi:glutathione S-transferase